MFLGYEMQGMDPFMGEGYEEMVTLEQVAEVKAKLAHTIRNTARRQHALTPGHMIKVLARDLPVDVQRSLAAEISTESKFSDIKTFLIPSGQLFFYSLNHITPEEAEAKGQVEEIKYLIAEKIRRNCRVSTALTPLSALYPIWPDIKPVQVCSMLNEMQTRAMYRDLKTISASSGELYFYSELHITEKYASLLVRSAVHDACAAIVQTVREESKLYPRPTNVSLFTSHVFGIPASSLQPCMLRILNNPEYCDIRKLVHPDTEAVYLYSNQHMNEEQACSIMRWLEEGSSPQPGGNYLG